MKLNYLKLLRKGFYGAFFLGVCGAIVAFSPKTGRHLPPVVNRSFFFDPTDYVNFTVTGFNDDVIANGISTTGAVNSSTNSVDASNYCYYEIGSQFTSTGSPSTSGLPVNGILTNPTNSDLTFQLASYDANNSLRIAADGAAGEASLTFAETGMYEAIYLAVTSGDGSSSVTGTINFDDNTTQAFTSLAVPDWYSGTALPVLIQGIGRVSRNTVSNPETSSNNPRIYQLTIGVDAANQSKTVTGITVQNTGGVLNIFAATGKLAAGCPSPTNIALSASTPTSASLTWDAYETNETYEVALVADGAAAPTEGEVVTTNAVAIDTLTAQTPYDFYVRTVCTTSGYSYWTGPFSFTTPCDAVTSFNEGFESYSSGSVPQCWSVVDVAGSGAWSVYDYSYYAHTGSKAVRIYTSGSTSANDYLITPGYAVTAHANDMFSFWARNSYSSYSDGLQVLVSTTGTDVANFTDVIASETIAGTSYNQYSYDLSAYDGQTIYIALRATSGAYHTIYVDDILTEAIPYCDAPTGLYADVTTTNATLSWTSDASAWELVVQDAGTGAPVSGTTVTDNSYSVDLAVGDLKEFYVRAACADNVNYSPWSGPYSFGGYAVLDITAGLSDDVIANGVGTSSSSVTNDIDGGDYAYMSKDFKVTESDDDLTVGLPVSGVISSAATTGLNYVMADYASNNSLRMETAGAGGTLTFASVLPAENIYFLVVSGGGSGAMSGTINFTDGTTQTIGSTSIPDWYDSTSLPVAISGIGRVHTTNDNIEKPAGNPRIYELTIAIDAANQSKTIESVDLLKVSGGVVNVFAASMKYSSYALATNKVDANVIAVYPNPVKDNLYIQGVEATNVAVYNVLGQRMNVVLTGNAVNMSGLDNGIYLVTIQSENGSKTVRVIKN